VPVGVEMLAYRRLHKVRDAVVAKMRAMIDTGVGTEAAGAARDGVRSIRALRGTPTSEELDPHERSWMPTSGRTTPG
jgi:hypothetical protein